MHAPRRLRPKEVRLRSRVSGLIFKLLLFFSSESLLRSEPLENTVVRLSFSRPKEASAAALLGGCTVSCADRSFGKQSAERSYVVPFPSPLSPLRGSNRTVALVFCPEVGTRQQSQARRG